MVRSANYELCDLQMRIITFKGVFKDRKPVLVLRPNICGLDPGYTYDSNFPKEAIVMYGKQSDLRYGCNR